MLGMSNSTRWCIKLLEQSLLRNSDIGGKQTPLLRRAELLKEKQTLKSGEKLKSHWHTVAQLPLPQDCFQAVIDTKCDSWRVLALNGGFLHTGIQSVAEVLKLSAVSRVTELFLIFVTEFFLCKKWQHVIITMNQHCNCSMMPSEHSGIISQQVSSYFKKLSLANQHE